MKELASRLSVLVVLLLVVGCSTAAPATVTVTASPSTTQKPTGADVQMKAAEMTTLLNKGCGESPKPRCDESSQALAGLANEARRLMADSSDPTFYSPAIAIAERVRVASTADLSIKSNTEVLRGEVIKLTRWIGSHPTA